MRTAGLDPEPVLACLLVNVRPLPGRFSNPHLTHDAAHAWLEPHPLPRQADMAEAAGVSLRTLSRWVNGGRIRPSIADSIAIRLGRHPREFWPEW